VRSQTSYLVVLMFMMACLAIVRLNPFGLLVDVHNPANLVVAVAMVCGALAVSLQRPSSFPIGLGVAALTVLCGALALAGVHGFRLSGSPLMWVVIGMYIAFRLTLVRQQARRQQQPQEPPRPLDPGAPQ
jgi:hypothetical protein